MLRLATSIVLLALIAWIVRLLAHSKKPEPEGIWREVVPEKPNPR
jgi:hypothetical protein